MHCVCGVQNHYSEYCVPESLGYALSHRTIYYIMIFTLRSVIKVGEKVDVYIGATSPKAWAIVGLSLLASGISIGWIILPISLNKLIPKKINLAYGEDTIRHWQNMPVFRFNIYLFNLTNNEAVRAGAKPIVQEIGPYCYREFKEKVEIKGDPKMDTISYRLRSTWVENQKSVECAAPQLTGEEVFVVPNVPLLSILLVAEKNFAAPFLAAVNVALPSIFGDNSDLFLTASARTLLFGGVLIDCWHRGVLTLGVCRGLRDQPSGLRKLGEDRYSFSFLGAKNGSVDGSQYTVRRGAEEATDVGRLVAVNGRPTLNYWRGDCNILNGTDGSIFPPFRRPDNRSLVAYSGEVCRVVHGVYEGEHDVNRVSGYAYTVTLGDTENEPQDKCYCAAVDRCYKKGTLDAYRCQGAPLVASLPHFYGGSQDYITGVSGIQPNKEKHEILVVLEPLFELNGELLELLEASLLRPVKVVHFGRWILVIFGVVLLLFSIIIKTKQIRRNSKLDPSKNFDYGPEFKEKLQSLDSEETVTSGPFFISQPPAIGLPQPRWGKTKNTAETLVSGGLVRTTAVGGVKTVKYKRISGLQEILVKEQERNQ